MVLWAIRGCYKLRAEIELYYYYGFTQEGYSILGFYLTQTSRETLAAF